MTDTRFAPGPATAYLTDDVIAMTVSDVTDAEVMALCVAIGEWSTMLAALADRRDMAVIHHDDEVLRVAVVGAVKVVVQSAEGEQRFDGKSAWTTREVERARRVTIVAGCDMQSGLDDDDDPLDDLDALVAGYRVDAGMVPASIVSRLLVAPAAEPDDPFEALFGHTIARSVEAAAVRSDEAGGEHEQAPLAVLVFSTGERVVVDRPMVLGRNPRPLDDDGTEASVRRVKIASAGVSRQHAMIRIDRWHASIDDLGSSNGTRIVLPGRPAKPVLPGHPVDLVAGAVVDLGGDVSFAVEEVA